MGVNYVVIPIGELDEQARSWLKTNVGLGVPAWDRESRNPTPAELRSVVESLSGYQIVCSKNGDDLDVDLQARDDRASWGNIWMHDYYPLCRDDVPHGFFFHRGDSALVIQVVERLAHTCGPFVVIMGGDSWAIVSEGDRAEDHW